MKNTDKVSLPLLPEDDGLSKIFAEISATYSRPPTTAALQPAKKEITEDGSEIDPKIREFLEDIYESTPSGEECPTTSRKRQKAMRECISAEIPGFAPVRLPERLEQLLSEPGPIPDATNSVPIETQLRRHVSRVEAANLELQSLLRGEIQRNSRLEEVLEFLRHPAELEVRKDLALTGPGPRHQDAAKRISKLIKLKKSPNSVTAERAAQILKTIEQLLWPELMPLQAQEADPDQLPPSIEMEAALLRVDELSEFLADIRLEITRARHTLLKRAEQIHKPGMMFADGAAILAIYQNMQLRRILKLKNYDDVLLKQQIANVAVRKIFTRNKYQPTLGRAASMTPREVMAMKGMGEQRYQQLVDELRSCGRPTLLVFIEDMAVPKAGDAIDWSRTFREFLSRLSAQDFTGENLHANLDELALLEKRDWLARVTKKMRAGT